MFDFKSSLLGFWSNVKPMFSRLAGIFGFKRKSEHQEPVAPKVRPPAIKSPPAIKKETAMELNMNRDDHDVGVILDGAEHIAKKKKAPKPPVLSGEEARNAAKMLPILMALSMARMGPEEEEVEKPTSEPKIGFTAKEKKRRSKANQRKKER